MNWITRFFLWVDSLFFPYEDTVKCYLVTVTKTVPDRKFEDREFVEEYLLFSETFAEAIKLAVEESFVPVPDAKWEQFYYKNDMEQIPYTQHKPEDDHVWMEGRKSKDNLFLNFREIRVAE